MMDKTTFTVGDSLLRGTMGDIKASPVKAPSAASVDIDALNKHSVIRQVYRNNESYADLLKAGVDQNPDDPYAAIQTFGNGSKRYERYMELQFHGGVTVDDIESITFKDTKSARLDDEMINSIKSQGIPVRRVTRKKVEDL